MTGVWDLGGLRLIALDTTVPGGITATLTPAAPVARGSCTPAPLGTLLAMHHPPLPSHIPLFDILELRDQGRLAEVDCLARTCAASSRATCITRRAAPSRECL